MRPKVIANEAKNGNPDVRLQKAKRVPLCEPVMFGCECRRSDDLKDNDVARFAKLGRSKILDVESAAGLSGKNRARDCASIT